MGFKKIMANIRKEQVFLVLYVCIIAAGLYKTYNYGDAVPTFSMPTEKKVILIDAGHGGWDPGKVNSTGTQEKDINLEISEKLQMMLEQGGSYVVMTRASDVALSTSKNNDLHARKNMAYNYKVDILVSIHQNSYPSGKVKGAQVFYFDNSDKSKLLAESIQKRLVEFADPNNKRTIESNAKYFMLKKTSVPSVIVECGFLTNYDESEKLKKQEYQEKIAWSIYTGIVDYFQELDKPTEELKEQPKE